MSHILAIDQGTTSTRAILFDAGLRPVAAEQQEFAQHFPAPGWVEHDPADLWATTLACARGAIARAGLAAADVAAIGITNQRETTLIWDRATGEPIHRAIVWQDRRTAPLCDRLRAEGHEAMVRARTGLVLDPYFSASKIAWLLDNVDGARARAGRGELAFGTVESFLIWRLTGGRVHATDATCSKYLYTRHMCDDHRTCDRRCAIFLRCYGNRQIAPAALAHTASRRFAESFNITVANPDTDFAIQDSNCGGDGPCYPDCTFHFQGRIHIFRIRKSVCNKGGFKRDNRTALM